MGRPSKLSDDQWAEFGRRLIEGEPMRKLAREFGVSDTSAREHFEKEEKKPTVQKVAKQLVEAEAALKSLPDSAQVSARNLAARLLSISDSLASAAELGAKTAHRLHGLANSEVQKIDDAAPLESLESLKGVNVLTRMGNDSANIALNLLSANKDAVKRLNEEPPEDEVLTPERLNDGVRRIAFMLHRAALKPESAHG